MNRKVIATEKYMLSVSDKADFERVEQAATALGYEFWLGWEYISCVQTLFLNPYADAEWSHRPASHYAGQKYTLISIGQLEQLAKEQT